MYLAISAPTESSIFLVLLLLPYAVSKIQFISPYQGQTLTGLVGSSVNFTWRFSGDVGGIEWGIKKAGAYVIEVNGRILFLDTSGKQVFVHQGYAGRVNRSRAGDSSSGQVIFTLSAITINDAKSYLCELKANNFLDSDQFDYVNLVVEEPSRITHPIAANESYNEGRTVTIRCTATGTPDPDVKWIHHGEVKSSGVKKADLTFTRIRKSDAGMYTCRVNNSARSDEKLLQLIVKCSIIQWGCKKVLRAMRKTSQWASVSEWHSYRNHGLAAMEFS